MINNADYLIQKFSEAREKMETYPSNDSGRNYWKGVMDTYHSLLTLGFNDWALPGSTGYYVFYENLTYESAINKIAKELAI
jgi:hypothetical protein